MSCEFDGLGSMSFKIEPERQSLLQWKNLVFQIFAKLLVKLLGSAQKVREPRHFPILTET
jgi:hypothetical protein